jgi:hypothetical protein
MAFLIQEEIKNLAQKYGGRIPKMVSGIGRAEGAVTLSTGKPAKFEATFQTLIRTNTNPNAWCALWVVPSDKNDPQVVDAHYSVFNEWQASLPGEGMIVIEKYREFFVGIE